MQEEQKVIDEMINKLYGPKYCEHCKCVQKIIVHKLAGSDFSKLEGTTLNMGYTGTQTCSVCLRVIE